MTAAPNGHGPLQPSALPGFYAELTEADWTRLALAGQWPPDGYRYVWVDDLVADPDWRAATGEEYVTKGCRHMLPGRDGGRAHGCGAGPVAALLRTVHRRTGDTKASWFYCRRHLFGHVWIDPVGGDPAHLLARCLVEGECEQQAKVKAAAGVAARP